MPPRRVAVAKSADAQGVNEKTAPVKKRISPNGHKLPEKLPDGEVLTDVTKNQWKLGKSIGVGGFGEIYLAHNIVGRAVPADAPYVVKVEPHSNGPLYVEMHFYHRVLKSEMINSWKAKQGLDFLGIPKYIASGSHEHNGNSYRFMVMERFGDDVQKLFVASDKMLSVKTVFTFALKLIDSLEYIHDAGYIHADVKGSNLLLGYGASRANEVYLVDFGLASLYVAEVGKHKEYKEDPRTAHNGTIEYTSRDAHIGVTSRRADLEILGYNMVQWLCGKLPWEDNLKNVKYVHEQKIRFMENIPSALRTLFRNKAFPEALEKFLVGIGKLKFDEKPDYAQFKKILQSGLKKLGLTDDGKLDIRATRKRSPSPRKVPKSVATLDENAAGESPPKRTRATTRKPCGLVESHRVQSNIDEAKKPSDKTPVSPSAIPTAAMLAVMERKRQKESQKQAKTKAKDILPARSQPVRAVRKTTTPRESFSPELF